MRLRRLRLKQATPWCDVEKFAKANGASKVVLDLAALVHDVEIYKLIYPK